MPGVPSSRGCDACRRQKKKCDEAKPACGRCTRLGIECIGAGKQRYKFQIHTKPQQPRKRSPKGSGSISVSTAQQEQRERQIASSSSPRGLFIHSTPTGNVQTAITGRLVSALQVTDPRFDLSVYGSFLREIPRRIGSSPALDAAVSAWTATIPLAMAVPITGLALAPVARPTVHMLHHYGYALATLRSSLSSRDSIAAPETLCALFLIVILQGWLQQEEDSFSGHGEAIAMILLAMQQHQTAWGEFEHGIVKPLSFLVVMESFVNPRIQLDSHLRRMADPEPLPAAKPRPQAISCLNNNYLVDVSTYLRAPYAHYSSLVEAYDRVRADRAQFAVLIASIPFVSSADGRILQPTSQQLCFVHLRYQTGYATLTLIAIRIAVVLARTPWSYSSATSARDLQLGDDLRIYVNDLATVAEQAVQYYPLGSSFMPLCLLAAYTTETSIGNDLQQRDRITQLFSRYRPGVDFQRICLKIKDVKDDSNAYATSEPQVPDAAACSVENNDVLVTNHDMCCIL